MPIEEMTIERQIILRRNCVAFIAQGKGTEERRKIAQQRIDRINAHWEELVQFAEENQIQPHMLPERGMMAVMGYHVGNDGVAKMKRREILGEVIEEPLPFVHTPMYMREWGAPNSHRRVDKVCSFFHGEINKPRGNARDFERAIKEWEDDLEFVQETWGHLVNG